MEYLTQFPGAVDYYTQNRRTQRHGQAFFNALPDAQAMTLVGTLVDPFYVDDRVDSAIEFLVDKGF